MNHYPKCPNCQKVIESGGLMQPGESRKVECYLTEAGCGMIFHAALDMPCDVPKRVSFCIHPKKDEKMRMLKENFEAALRIAIASQTNEVLYNSTFIAGLKEILVASIAGTQITISEN